MASHLLGRPAREKDQRKKPWKNLISTCPFYYYYLKNGQKKNKTR
jgi:hypothetical protein